MSKDSSLSPPSPITPPGPGHTGRLQRRLTLPVLQGWRGLAGVWRPSWKTPGGCSALLGGGGVCRSARRRKMGAAETPFWCDKGVVTTALHGVGN